MIISQVFIKNFRSIKNATLNFNINLQTLVGINEAGKSNVLRAISLISPKVEILNDDLRDASSEEDAINEAYVRFVFHFTAAEQKELKESVSSVILTNSPDAPLLSHGGNEMTLMDFIKYKSQAIFEINLLKKTKYATHFTILEKSFKIFPHWCFLTGRPPGPIVFNNTPTDITRYKIINTSENQKIDPSLITPLTLDALNSFVGNYYRQMVETKLPECISWSYQESLLLPGKIDYAEFSSQPDTCLPLKIMFGLAGHSDPKEEIVRAEGRTNGIRNLLHRVGEITTAHMRTVWPEWNRLKVQITQNGDYIDAGIHDEFNFYSLERRSDGFKRFFTFLLLLSAQSKTKEITDKFILVDEPEIGLHPSGQTFLKNELIKIATNNTVLMSTHSIFMIDRERIERHIIVKKSHEITHINRIDSSNITEEEVVMNALGFSLFELLRPVNIIFEGWRDKKLFQTYLNSKVPLKIKQKLEKLGLLHAIGVKDIARVAAMCDDFNRQYLIITDADAPALERKKAFRDQTLWITYQDIEALPQITSEDFINKRKINDAITEILNEYQVPPLKISTTTTSGYLALVEKHLKDVQSDKTTILNKIKSHIVDHLTADDIIKDYAKVIDRIHDYTKLKNPSSNTLSS